MSYTQQPYPQVNQMAHKAEQYQEEFAIQVSEDTIVPKTTNPIRAHETQYAAMLNCSKADAFL